MNAIRNSVDAAASTRPLSVLCTTVLGSILALSLGFSSPALSNPDVQGLKFGKWEALGKGFMGRKKEIDHELCERDCEQNSKDTYGHMGIKMTLNMPTFT